MSNILDDFNKNIEVKNDLIIYEGENIAYIKQPHIYKILSWSTIKKNDIHLELINYLQNYPVRICLYLESLHTQNLICFYMDRILSQSNLSALLDWEIFNKIVLDTLNYYSIDIENIIANKNGYKELYRILVTGNRIKIINELL